MEVKSTRLRFVSSKELDLISGFIDSLPFKVELKSLVLKGSKFYQTFIIPDSIPSIANVDLD